MLRVARMERLTQEKSQAAAFRKESENAAPLRTVTKTLSYARADQVKALLTSQGFILSDRGSVVVDERSNMLIIRDASDRLEGIVNLIDSVDQPNKQVVIEARIVESTRRFAQRAWRRVGLHRRGRCRARDVDRRGRSPTGRRSAGVPRWRRSPRR